jgi:hypothetical protein
MRCPDCNKFVGLEMQDPEVNSLDVEVDITDKAAGVATATVTCEVRIVRACADCGTELKEATLDMTEEVEIKFPKGVGASDVEVREANVNQIEEGGGRYAKSYFGAEVEFEIVAGDQILATGSMADKVAASGMDEMV